MRYVLFAFTAPWSVIVGWGWMLLLYCITAVKDLRWEPTLVLTGEFRDWVVRPRNLPWGPKGIDGKRAAIPLWRFSTTLGRAIAYQPGHRAPKGEYWTYVQQHEHVHIRQVEDRMLLSFIIGFAAFLVVGLADGMWGTAVALGLVLWFSGGAWQLPNFLTALMRGQDVYRDSEHELSAYAQSDPWGPQGESWLDRHSTRLRKQ